ncbi:MAG: hypothetical protein K2N78_07880 [Oscillospiraceae bacterium]|nr:hypothetical protein [Oscillospiraceae bacterium]
MASFGAKYPHFCKITDEPEGELPVYDGNPIRIGRLVKADLSVTMASGKLYADDTLAEVVEEFVNGSLSMETDDMEDTVASAVYGAEVIEKQVHYKSGDSAPVGGLTYYKVLKRRGKTVYKGYFYPRVQAALGNDSAQTKTDSITFGTTNTTFTVFPCESTDWRITAEFEDEKEVRSWVKTKRFAGEGGDGSEV